MAIAPGRPHFPLSAMQNGRCTWFHPRQEPLTARKQWIAGALQPQGRVTVDGGAVQALARGGSLLPAGIVAVDGDFQKGDAVVLADTQGRDLGRGLTAYGADEARQLIRRKSADFERLLGYRGPDELIHRDDLVLTP
jgi:glutamate 5-kinase